MSSPSIVTCLLGIYFFLTGCLQIAMHISTTPTDPFAPFLYGLAVASWPLGVAGVLFILLDIRSQQAINAHRSRLPMPGMHGADDAADIPTPHPVGGGGAPGVTPQVQPEVVSYFGMGEAPQMQPQPAPQPPVQPPHATPPAPQPSIFAVPPPFAAQPPSSEDDDSTIPLSHLSPAALGMTPKYAEPTGRGASQGAHPNEQSAGIQPPPATQQQQSELSFFKL